MHRLVDWTIPLAAAACWTAAWAQQAAPPAAPPAPPPAATAPAPVKKKPAKDTAPVPKFESRLAGNAALLSRVQALLPKGTTLEAATKGFKNEGDFIATLHASHDLNLPFDQLKADVIGSEHDSIAQAIRNFRPELNMKAIEDSAKKAEQQAKADVKETREPRGTTRNDQGR